MAFYLKLLENNVRQGIVHLTLPNGKTHTFGNSGPEVHWVFNDMESLMRVVRNWELEMGETYMHQGWDLRDCSLYDLISVLRQNFPEYTPGKWLQPFMCVLQQWNKISRSYRNAAHHYDLDEALFRRFLDREMHYSCAYYANDSDDIHTA